MSRIVKFACLVVFCSLKAWPQEASTPSVPVQMVVTVGHHYGHEPPAISSHDLTVTQDYAQLPVTNVIPLRGNRAALELFVLVDNCSNCEPGPLFEELRHFLVSLPATTQVGVAYIDSGRVRVVENPTQDRERAVQALSAPAGSKPSSPFGAVSELIHGWRQGPSQRAVLMISNGIDPAATDTLAAEPPAERALRAAQSAGV